MNAPPHLAMTPRLEACTAHAVWDGEAALLRVTFDCAPPPPSASPTRLSQQLDQQFGVRARAPRLILGDVDVAYRDERHLESIELRTTPSAWQRQTIDDVPADAAPVWFAFDVEYDDNGIVSLDLPVSICWDAVADRLALVFAPRAARNWYRIADSVAVGTSADGTLAELWFSAVEIHAGPGEGGR